MRCQPTNPAPPVTSNVWLTDFLPLRRSAARLPTADGPTRINEWGRPAGMSHQGLGAGGTTTGGRSSQVIVLGRIHDASQPPSLPPRSVTVNSLPVGGKLNRPQLLTPTAPTFRASTFSNVALPPTRARSTLVPVPSILTSLKWTLVIE